MKKLFALLSLSLLALASCGWDKTKEETKTTDDKTTEKTEDKKTEENKDTDKKEEKKEDKKPS